jgi:membrane protease YdiL (CAAX protease family)
MLSRILHFPLTMLLIEAIAVVAVAVLISLGVHAMHLPKGLFSTLAALVFAAANIGLWKALQRRLERRADGEFPAGGAVPEAAAGLLFGIVLFSVMAGAVALLGGLTIGGFRGWACLGSLGGMLALAITSGVFEETLFRGVLFRHVETMLGTWAALVITAAFFGAAHLFNPGATWFAAVAIMMEAGILLGAAYMLTRRLWLAVGIHAGWNFAQGWVFSAPVSGGEAPVGLLITSRAGPEWLTGGAFGLEASAVAMVTATVAGLVVLVLAVRRHGSVAPMWIAQKTGSQ